MITLRWWMAVGLVAAFPVLVAAQEADNKERTGLKVTPSGYVQVDFRGYPNWPIVAGVGPLNRDNFEVRRVRGGIDGEWRFLTFEVKVDPQDEDGGFVKDAYAEFRLSESLRFRVGQFKLPGSREYLTSARNIDFVERSAIATYLAAGRDIGAAFEGTIGKKIDYQAGFFAGDGNGRQERAAGISAGRIQWEFLKDLQIGASFSEGRIRSVPDDQPENGFEGRTPSGYRFFDRVYAQGRRLRFGMDVEWEAGPFRINAEGLRVRDERREQGVDYDDLPSILGEGWSLSARWRFGRARHLSLRYEGIGLDDAGPATGRDSVRPRASDIRAKVADAVTMGISWKPHRVLRFMGNAGIERYAESRSAPQSGQTGNYYTVASRLQFEWP